MDIVALVLAAGKGTRMNDGLASPIPKVMFRANGKPLIGYVVESLEEAGIKEVIPIVGYKKEMVIKYVDGKHRFAIQKEQKGTGHAVACAKELIGKDFDTVLVTCGDMPLIEPETFQKAIQVHEKEKPVITILSANYLDPTGYGRIIRDENGNVDGIVEEKDCDAQQKRINECNTSTYVFDAKWLWKNIDKLSSHNAQGEIYLTDLVHLAWQDGEKLSAISTDEQQAHGINTVEQLIEVEEILNSRKAGADLLKSPVLETIN